MQGSNLIRRASDIRDVAQSAIALLLLAGTFPLHAQSAPCGLTSISEQSQLIYPPIARAAHVSGTVILLVRFGQDGSPTNARVVSGPPMLQSAAVDFVKNWRANSYNGPRECPIVIKFKMMESDKPLCSPEEAGPPKFARSDLQHVSLSTQGVSFCDPGMTVIKTKKRWFN